MRLFLLRSFAYLFLILFQWVVVLCIQPNEIHSPFPNHANGMIFISTMDGYLRTIEPLTGVEKWSLKEEPVLKAPSSIQHGFTFLPDPQSGGLYLLRNGQLKKLPYSIPELVSASPCRTTDGVMYAGYKKDVWLGINQKTGIKEEELSQSSDRQECPANSEQTIFIGRSEYQLTMFDASNHRRRWNVTFTDYSSHLLLADVSYPYQHFASSSDGRLLTVDASTGTILWEQNFGSTIVAIYLLQNDGLHKLPYTVIGKETIEVLAKNAWGNKQEGWMDDLLHAQNVYSSTEQPKSLFPTLYVGESNFGLYAIPAFVDEKTITIAPKYLGPPLIEGPMPIAVKTEDAPRNTPSSRPVVLINIDMPSITHRTEDGEFLLLGYHEPPAMMVSQLLLSRPMQFARFPSISYEPQKKKQEQQNETSGVKQLTNEDEWTLDFIFSQLWKYHPTALASALLSAFVLILTTVWMCGRQTTISSTVREEAARSVQTSKRFGRFLPFLKTEVPEEGWMQVGNILYDPQTILGRGCEGTIVYRGKFDGREVAVKRVVADFVRLVDREVDLLRESDAHTHVIRYFCMESDSLFRYIALELCEASLHDYVEKDAVREKCPLSAMNILLQATNGVAYLHSISIVHRDIKPQNVLLSAPNKHGQVRALISDFGLCKRIQKGRHSVSRRSGLAGTDGWIAPEALISESSVTCAVDVFSLGCIYYYVLTGGSHPFGDNLRRQANIMQGEYSLKTLNASNNVIAVDLIELMLQRDPSARPTAAELVMHPFFWSKERQLQFFSDVSDRIEKEDEQSLVVRRLEKNARGVVSNNWRQAICSALAEDLRKFRTYKGSSVRDLLRAMRNKRHHYRELPEEVRSSLGRIPDEFVTYFTSRFPKLLMHTYSAMRVCAGEHVFCGYYSEEAKKKAAAISDEEVLDSDEWTTTARTNERPPKQPSDQQGSPKIFQRAKRTPKGKSPKPTAGRSAKVIENETGSSA